MNHGVPRDRPRRLSRCDAGAPSPLPPRLAWARPPHSPRPVLGTTNSKAISDRAVASPSPVRVCLAIDLTKPRIARHAPRLQTRCRRLSFLQRDSRASGSPERPRHLGSALFPRLFRWPRCARPPSSCSSEPVPVGPPRQGPVVGSESTCPSAATRIAA